VGPEPALHLISIDLSNSAGNLSVGAFARVKNEGNRDVAPGLPYRVAVTNVASGNPPFLAEMRGQIYSAIRPDSVDYIAWDEVPLTPAVTPPGNYYLVVTLDPDRVTQDTDRGDNQSVGTFTIP
jgi:hypothetical protein